MRAWLHALVRPGLVLGAAIFAVAIASSTATAQTDVIRGHVTNSEGLPLPGVQVTATSIPGNVTRGGRTNNDGAFQIAFPNGPGDYILGFSLIGYNFRQFELKRLADEDVLIGDARLTVLQTDTLVVVAQRQERVSRDEATRDATAAEQEIAAEDIPPELQGDIAAMAASLPGVLLVPGLDGEADGFSVLGLGADENAVTLNGMTVDANGLPRDAAVSSSLSTSSFDPSQGGFSGASYNIRSASGSNFRTRGMSLVTTTPQVQWTDQAARALGAEYTNVSLGGVASGPIVRNKSFYNVSYQLGRQSRDNQNLLTTSALGLQTAGIAMDSVNRFLGILHGEGVSRLDDVGRSDRLSDNGSVFGSLDFAPPGSSSGQAFGVTFNGNWGRQSPVGASQLSLASAGGDRTNWRGGVQARHSGYFGMILSETSAGINVSHNSGDPYLSLPAGRVRVNSIFDDGGSGVQTLTFGGNQSLGTSSRSAGANLQNTLSWFDSGNKHRIKLTVQGQYSGESQDQSTNLLGSFLFNSLADLEAGLPATFSRTLSAHQRSTGQFSGSLALGDSYRRTQNLQIQYGLRLDASRYTTAPRYNPLVESVFGLRNDEVPTPLALSPRIGFSWTVGRAREVASFAGAARVPRAVIRGGVGVFSNSANVGQIGSALDNTGLASGTQQIVCVGPAVPIPDWAGYYDDAAAIPTTCSDGTSGSVFSNSAPNVTLFDSGFAPQKSVRSNLSWSGAVLDSRFSLNVGGTYSLNLNQQRFVDLNFDPDTRFTLAAEGRPVFVEPTSIVPMTGSIASGAGRVSQEFSRVTEMRSDLRSRTAELTFRLSPILRGPSRFAWSAAYTYADIRQQVSGFNSTAGSPLGVEWANAAQGPHQINYNLRYTFFDAVQVNWNGSFRSGTAFTPMISGDVNGDGYSNDRAFIYSSATASDPALAEGMRQLLASASPATRSCLEKQLGTIASRNSCRGPWSSNASLNVTLDRAKFHMPRRGSISFSLSNPLGAADLLVNGSNGLKGWGQTATPDQALLYVRGFDATTQQYRYEVNQRFGATRPQFLTLRNPVMLTASVRIDLGPTREHQTLEQQIRQVNEGAARFAQFQQGGQGGGPGGGFGGGGGFARAGGGGGGGGRGQFGRGGRGGGRGGQAEPAEAVAASGDDAVEQPQFPGGRGAQGAGRIAQLFRQVGANSLPNPLATILRSQDSLSLASVQADSIASMNRRYTFQSDSVWSAAGNQFAALPTEAREKAAYGLYLRARHAQVDLLKEMGPIVRKLLSSEQRRKLPPSVGNLLDPRYLASVRDGTGMYVRGSATTSDGGFGGGGGGRGGGGGGRRGG